MMKKCPLNALKKANGLQNLLCQHNGLKLLKVSFPPCGLHALSFHFCFQSALTANLERELMLQMKESLYVNVTRSAWTPTRESRQRLKMKWKNEL